MFSLQRIIPLGLLLGVTLGISACNGGGSDNTAPAGSVTSSNISSSGKSIKGVAATGAAIVGGNVSLKCSAGTPVATTTAADGSYNITLTDQLAPCVLAVTGGQINGVANTQVLHSAALGAGIANITPLTEMALAQAIHGDPAQFYNGFGTALASKISVAALQQAQTVLNLQLAGLRGAASAGQIGDYFTGNLQPGNPSNPMDVLLDNLGSSLAGAQVPLANIVATLGNGGSLQQLLGAIVPGTLPGTVNLLLGDSCLYVAQTGDSANFKVSDSSGAAPATTSKVWQSGSYGGANVLLVSSYDQNNQLLARQYLAAQAAPFALPLLAESYRNGSKTLETTYSVGAAGSVPTSIGQSLNVSATLSSKAFGSSAASLQAALGTDTLNARMTLTLQYVGNEFVTVPAGTFNTCRYESRVQLDDFSSTAFASLMPSSGTVISWYAPGIGEVKSASTATTSGVTITSELLNGRFSGVSKP